MTSYDVWELPEFYMNAGETKLLRLPVYNKAQQLIDATGMTGILSVSDYINRGTAIFTVACSVERDEQCGGSIFLASFPSEDTINLCGKYIYQLSISDVDDARGVLRGVVVIGHNSNKAAFAE